MELWLLCSLGRDARRVMGFRNCSESLSFPSVKRRLYWYSL